MASTRPPDKIVKNPLLTSADQSAFFEEFAHSRLLVAPPAPHPVSTPGSGHVSSVGKDTATAEIRDPTLTHNPQVQESDKDPSSDQTFTEIPLTPGSNISALPAHPVTSSAPPPVGPPPTSSGPPPCTGFIRSAPLSRYIPSNFIQTSLPTPAPLQIFQGAPSAPVGVSLLDPTQVEQSEETVAASARNSVPESSQASISPPLQNQSVLNDQKVPAIPETPSQQFTPVSHSSAPQSTAPPPAFPQVPNTNVPLSSPQTFNSSSGFAVYSQPLTQPVNANPSVSSPPSVTSPASNAVPLIPKATSIPRFPATSNFSSTLPTATLPSSKSTDFPFVPVFPKPNSGNFVPTYPINLVNENPITAGLVPPQLRSSPSPLSSKHSTPPPGSQTPLLLSAERGSPSIAQASNNSGYVEPPQVPVSLSPQTAPPIKPGSPAQVAPPPQVGPPPRGNSSAYPSALLSRSAANRSGLGQHSSSSLRQSTIPKASSEQQVQFFTPAPVDNVYPPTFDQAQPGSFISPSNQPPETEKPKGFLSSAASYFNITGDSGTAQHPQHTGQNDTGFYQSLNQQSPPPSSLPYSSPGATYSTTSSQLGHTFPQAVPTSSTSSYFQPAPPTSLPNTQFFQDSSSGNPPTLFAPPPVASGPSIPTVQPPPLLNQSRPSSVGSVSSLQSAGSFPPVASPFSSNSQKPFTHPPPSSYFTPISESDNQQSPSPAPSVTSSQGSLSSTLQHSSYTHPSLPESSNQPLSFFNPTHFATPPSQAFNPLTSAYPLNPTIPPHTADLSSEEVSTSVPPPSTPTTAPSADSFDSISASFSQVPASNANSLSFSAFSTDIPPQNFASASSFFQSAPPSTQTSTADSFPVSSSLQQTVETRSSTPPSSQLASSERITPSNTPPPTYGSLDTRDPIANPNCNIDDSPASVTDGRPVEPTSDGTIQYCGPRPTSLPPAASSQGNTYRRTSLKRPSYAPVPDLGVSHQSAELMGQSQQLSGYTGARGTMQEEPPTAPTPHGGRAHSSSPHSPDKHMSVDQSMDFSGQGAPSVGRYRPAFHHWFFKKNTKRAVWQPFSMADSLNIEQAFVSPEISDATKVPTDGGRYDVEILHRKKTAVYWEEDPSEVRRCSWFVKSPTEARYIPYDENIAAFLEEEYKQGCLSNEWNRRIELADGEVIILNSPNVMAHHQRSSSPDNWGNPPAMQQKPRIVKRGLEDFEISEGEPTQVDHLLLVVHGIGKVCDLRFRSLVEVVDDFRSVSLQLVQSHFRKALESGQVGRVEVLPVEWHQALHTETIDKRLADITLPSIPKAREFTNDTILDVLFYSSPMFSEKIVQAVGVELNRTYDLFMQRNPGFAGCVSLGGHSLGSLILFDMLSHQKEIKQQQPARRDDEVSELGAHTVRPPMQSSMSYLSIGLQGATQPTLNYPQLNFYPNALFAFGSPIGMFLTVRGIESLGEDFRFPTCPRFFNIFHPNDPVAYRIEALICNEMAKIPPVLIPHHKGRKRMHLELKETMAHITTALKQKLVHSVRSTWNTVYQLAMFQRPDSSLQREVDEALEEEELHGNDVEPPSPALSSTQSVAEDQGLEIQVGSLNGGNRVDYVLQEAPLETFNQYISAIRSHVVYWESEDTMLMVLKEIYLSMNIMPDSQVPQQILPFDINTEDHYTEYTDSIGAPHSSFIRK